ncbi:hypothetical protein GGI42DRAFT_116440 [Trichoderma sp. SZMC 28013]
MLQVCCYIQPAEITSARPRFCAAFAANPIGKPPSVSSGRFSWAIFYKEHLLGSERCYMASRILAMGCLARGHSLSAEASGIIQSKAPRLSCHQMCRPIPALGTRLQARHSPIVERDGQG